MRRDYLPDYAGTSAEARHLFTVARCMVLAEAYCEPETIRQAAPVLVWLERGGPVPDEAAMDAAECVAAALAAHEPRTSGMDYRPDLKRAETAAPDLGRVWMEVLCDHC